MTTTPATRSASAACVLTGMAHANTRGSGLSRAVLALGATMLHYAGHQGGQIFGCLVPLLHLPALDVGAATLLLAASIYADRRRHKA